MTTGIYKIQSKVNPDRVYIGSSVNIKLRWSVHLSNLKTNKHNNKLQYHYNKYGKDDLVFSILLECGKDSLTKEEQRFVDLLNPYFNICKDITDKSFMGEECFKDRHFKKEVRQYNLSGVFIKQWGSLKEAEDNLNIANLCDALKKRNKSAGGFIWCYKGERKPKYKKDIIANKRQINQYNLSDEFIREWDCIMDVQKELGIDRTGITRVLRHQRNCVTAGGYKWKYKND